MPTCTLSQGVSPRSSAHLDPRLWMGVFLLRTWIGREKLNGGQGDSAW